MYFVIQFTSLYWLFSRNGVNGSYYIIITIIQPVVNSLETFTLVFYTERAIHPYKNSLLMKNPEWSLFS